MLDGSMLTFSNQSGPGKNNGKQRYIVDDLHQRAKPTLFQRWVEASSQGQVNRQRLRIAMTLGVFLDLRQNDLLDVLATGKRLTHACGVNIELNFRLFARQHVTLKVRRYI